MYKYLFIHFLEIWILNVDEEETEALLGDAHRPGLVELASATPSAVAEAPEGRGHAPTQGVHVTMGVSRKLLLRLKRSFTGDIGPCLDVSIINCIMVYSWAFKGFLYSYFVVSQSLDPLGRKGY